MSRFVKNVWTWSTHVQETYGGVFTRVACLPKSLTKKMKAPAVIDAEATVSKKLDRCSHLRLGLVRCVVGWLLTIPHRP